MLTIWSVDHTYLEISHFFAKGLDFLHLDLPVVGDKTSICKICFHINDYLSKPFKNNLDIS